MTALYLSPVIAALFFLIPSPALTGEEGDIRNLVASLPGKLKALYEENEDAFAGSTVDMANASHAIGEGLLPD